MYKYRYMYVLMCVYIYIYTHMCIHVYEYSVITTILRIHIIAGEGEYQG